MKIAKKSLTYSHFYFCQISVLARAECLKTLKHSNLKKSSRSQAFALLYSVYDSWISCFKNFGRLIMFIRAFTELDGLVLLKLWSHRMNQKGIQVSSVCINNDIFIQNNWKINAHFWSRKIWHGEITKKFIKLGTNLKIVKFDSRDSFVFIQFIIWLRVVTFM